MRPIIACVTSVILSVLYFTGVFAVAPTVTVPTEVVSTNPPIAVTSFGGEAVLQFAELYNQLDVPVQVDGWRVNFTVVDMAVDGGPERTVVTTPLRGWLLPDKYISLQRDSTAEATINFTVKPEDIAGFVQPRLLELWLSDATGEKIHEITIPASANLASSWFQHKQRGKALTATNNFAKDFVAKTGIAEIFSEPTYEPLTALRSLEIHEILAYPAECGPIDSSLACGDYIKLRNTGDKPINIAAYRLRAGYQGQAVGVNTMFTWGRAIDPTNDELWLAPGQFFMLHTRNDHTVYKNQPLQLTNSGGFVWLEDAWGVVTYGDSAVSYPSTNGKQGFSWARNLQDAWQWAYPAPGGVNNLRPLPSHATKTVTACRPGYYRSTETNRCRLLSSSTISAPCQPGQTRNPATNRCRNNVTVGSALTPCKPGQTRSPETNRCRSGAATIGGPAPCKAGQERNPETNRCRKATNTSLAASITDQPATPASMIGWWIAGAVGAGALGYAVYEWRQPLLAAGQRIGNLFRRRPPTA